MTTATANVAALESAKETYKAALLKQVEPINQQIAELKTQLATLETSKRTIEAQVKLIDRKPGQGKPWSAEAKARLSESLKAAAARKKAAQANPASQSTQSPAPVVDVKARAANDDSAASQAASKKKTGTK
jgi:hypothetical protein